MAQTDDLHFAPDFERARTFFEAQDAYAASPLLELQTDSGQLFLAKDETGRMGLGAFKALGAPYAVSRILQADWPDQNTPDTATANSENPSFRKFAASRTFVCASAGNHGIGVAAGARLFGAKARIHLASTVPPKFAERLRALGAEVVWSGAVYEESVAAATADASSGDATLLADGTWPGYTEIPKLVMEGYCVMAEELREVFDKTGSWPTHVFLQAGVGGLAAAMAHMIRLNWAQQPALIVVEPDYAACLKASHLAGRPTRSEGPDSNMGRLDCKDPSIVAWHTLERCDVEYETLSEDDALAAADGMRTIGLPTTPSGAAGFGALLKHIRASDARDDFRPLVLITEGPA
ncbi:MAG: pyridoxal-phosphate dependent enzyme [Pseudomonadota bacterium]